MPLPHKLDEKGTLVESLFLKITELIKRPIYIVLLSTRDLGVFCFLVVIVSNGSSLFR